MNIDWDHIYLLGWVDHQGRQYLTTWDGELPMIGVVLTGVTPLNIPLWSASIPKRAKLHVIPDGKNGKEYAKEIGGYYAFGWYIEEGVKRKTKEYET